MIGIGHSGDLVGYSPKSSECNSEIQFSCLELFQLDKTNLVFRSLWYVYSFTSDGGESGE